MLCFFDQHGHAEHLMASTHFENRSVYVKGGWYLDGDGYEHSPEQGWFKFRRLKAAFINALEVGGASQEKQITLLISFCYAYGKL